MGILNKERSNKDDPAATHKKGSKSLGVLNPLDIIGAQLASKLEKLETEKHSPPDLSKQHSPNNSVIDNSHEEIGETDALNYKIPLMMPVVSLEDEHEVSINSTRGKSTSRGVLPSDFENLRMALSAKQGNVQHQQTPEASVSDMQVSILDESLLREKLVHLIKDHFRNQNSAPKTTLDYYRIGTVIGKGAFSKVYLGTHILTGQHVAIKAIDKVYMKDEFSKKKVFQEVLILKTCNHRNVIRLLEVFENQKYLFIVQEHASGGDLLTYVKERGRLPENEAKLIFMQIVLGVQHCHGHNILHRDIKPDNILIDKGMTLKLCDFGVSRFVKKGQTINEQCGTPAYIAPEIIRDKGYEGCYPDLWSMGVLLYALVTGTVPFKGSTIDELHRSILMGKYSFPSYLSAEVMDLISQFLKLNPHSRIAIGDILKHRWFGNLRQLDDFLSPGQKVLSGAPAETKNPIKQGKQVLHKRSHSLNKTNAVQEDRNSVKINPLIVDKVEKLGFPREHIIEEVESNSCSHAYACYFLFQKMGNQY